MASDIVQARFNRSMIKEKDSAIVVCIYTCYFSRRGIRKYFSIFIFVVYHLYFISFRKFFFPEIIIIG